MVIPFKAQGRHGWGTEREGDEKLEFGFTGFGHVKCEVSTLLTRGNKENVDVYVWCSKEKSKLETDTQESTAKKWQLNKAMEVDELI